MGRPRRHAAVVLSAGLIGLGGVSTAAAAPASEGSSAELTQSGPVGPNVGTLSSELAAPHRAGAALVRVIDPGVLEALRAEWEPTPGSPAAIARDVLRGIDARVTRSWSMVPGLAQITFPGPVSDALEAVRARPDVFAYAAPDHAVFPGGDLPACQTATDGPFVNDPLFPLLYGMLNLGRPINGSPASAGIDINVDSAWRVVRGDPDLIIAVIDSGIDVTHPDLNANIFVNTVEQDGLPGVDDDLNGLIDDINGWDFVEDDNTPGGASSARHGTHVAGTIAALGNNGKGVTGVVHRARLLPCKFIGDVDGSVSGAISAIEYAVRMGARLSNNSWGTGVANAALEDAIRAAGQAGHLMIVSAGNAGRNIDQLPFYPASFPLSNLVVVANLTPSGTLNPDSNYGFNTVDIAAPGTNIFSTVENGQYAYLSGTSMAAPHVTGVAALIMAQNPEWTFDQVRARLLETARPLIGLDGRVASAGIVSAAAAINAPSVTPFVVPVGVLPAAPEITPAGDALTIEAVLAPGSDEISEATLYWRDGPGPYTPAPMALTGANDRWSATIPATACGRVLEYAVQFTGVRSGCFSIPRETPGAEMTTPRRVRVGTLSTAHADTAEVDPAGTWTLGDPGDTATAGMWTWGRPVGTALGDQPVQPDSDATPGEGVHCFFTGQHPQGGVIGAADVDTGATTLISPPFSVDALGAPRVSYARWLYAGDADDALTVSISADDGATWTLLERVHADPSRPASNAWTRVRFDLAWHTPNLPRTATMRLRFVAEDAGASSLVEAAIDDVLVEDVVCPPSCAGDFDNSGDASVEDLFAFINAYFAGSPAADIDNSGTLDVGDLFGFIVIWFACP